MKGELIKSPLSRKHKTISCFLHKQNWSFP